MGKFTESVYESRYVPKHGMIGTPSNICIGPQDVITLRLRL